MEPNLTEITKLLGNVDSLLRQSKKISALKGENFNIFKIFDLERDENKMHSRFINTLINPKGEHDRGTIFLELFLETIGKTSYFNNLNNVYTKVEHSLGKVVINGMESTGGRIDIYISNDKKHISIENKIHAPDQEKQIVRYCNHINNEVYYLKLNVTEPDDDSKGTLKSNLIEAETPDFYCISYSETILEWLEKCQKEAADLPIIRETIKQYIITIKRLTGQLTNQEMEKELHSLLLENYESSKYIADNFIKAKIELTNIFLDELIENIKIELGNEWNISKRNNKENWSTKSWSTKSWSTIIISNEAWINNAKITIQAQPYFFESKTIIGVTAKENSNIKRLLQPIFNGDENDIRNSYPRKSKIWLFYKTLFNLNKPTEFKKLNEESQSSFIESITKDVIALAEILNKYFVKKDNN